MKKIVLLLVALISIAVGSYWFLKEPNWNQNAIKDVDKIYQLIINNHPASVDPEYPEFKNKVETLYAIAKENAKKVQTSAGHFYALRSMTVPFHDLHLSAGFYKSPERTYKWPGFAVQLDKSNNVIVALSESENVPPQGARLLSCDGVSIDELLSTKVNPFIGNWALNSKRPLAYQYLFIDSANPFIEPINTCIFEHKDSVDEYVLTWQHFDKEARKMVLDLTEPLIQLKTGLRFLEDGSAWISVASFGNSTPADVEIIKNLIKSINENRDLITKAPALVIDVRGNGGGSSLIGIDITSAIWGQDYINEAIPRINSIDWRASEFNLNQLNTFLPHIKKANGEDSEVYKKMKTIQVGMNQAISQKLDYFIQKQSYPPLTGAKAREVPNKIFFLTDYVCVSACLDFADLLLSLPDVSHIGQETSGDTKYLEVLTSTLPSGVAQLAYPTAIHRGRERGDNVSYVPEFIWEGDIADTKAIESWIKEL